MEKMQGTRAVDETIGPINRYAPRFLPEYMVDGVLAYIKEGRPMGDFLNAVFSNDFIEACVRADSTNRQRLVDYALFLVNYCPRGCYGSAESVKSWVESGGLVGLNLKVHELAREAGSEQDGKGAE